jgi:hypothetical protein
MAPEGDAGAGGSVADDKGAKFTDAQLEQLTSLMGNMVNGAVTNKIKGLKFDEMIGKAVEGLGIDEKIAEAIGSVKPPEVPGAKPPEGNGGTGGQVDPAITKQLKELADKLEASEKRAKDAEEAAAKAEEKRQFDAGRQALFEGLTKHAAPTLHDVWVDNLIHHGKLKVEEGAAMLEVEHSPFKGAPKQKEFLPLSDALPKLLESEDAKRFMKAPEGGNPGGGSRGPTAPGVGGATDPFAAVMAKLGGSPSDINQ